jgi:hypothetical protein
MTCLQLPTRRVASLRGRHGRHSHVLPTCVARQVPGNISQRKLWLSEWRIAVNVSKRSAMLFVKTGSPVPKPRSLRLFGEPIQWVDTARYFGMTLDKRLTWSAYIDQARRKAAQMLGTRGPFLNRRSNLSIRNCVLLYKQLIRPMMDYACPVWRSAARSHIKKLQVL